MLYIERILLLASALGSIAQGNIFPPRLLVTSSFGQRQGVRDELLVQRSRRDASVVVRAPSSVVQDWSLVCKQLCGAGLGGDSCAPYCTTINTPKEVQEKIAQAVLSSNKEPICLDLCRLQLGGAPCQCGEYAVDNYSLVTLNDHNLACSTYCDNSGKTLNGCSECRSTQEPTKNIGYNMPIQGRSAVTSAPSAEPTPNWNEVCAQLCKTGDGGSLCNCNLSPFFLRV